MIQPPSKVVTGDDLNRLRTDLDTQRIASGVGYRISFGAGGATIGGPGNPFTSRHRSALGSGSGDHPFRVRDASADGTAKVRITAGTLNNIVPTIPALGVSLDATPAPVATVTHPHILLKVTVDSGGVVTDVEVANLASVPADTATTCYLLIATITIDSGSVVAVQQYVSTSVQHIMCGTAETPLHRFGRV